MPKINIETRYPSEGEIRKSDLPYNEYGECLLKTFPKINSFCDVGCATGHLMSFLKERTGCKTKGYEYFEYHKTSEYCKNNIKEDIIIYDIRDSLPEDTEKFEIVNCSEVGEHIDAEYADVLIENSKKLSSKYIIFTWSSHGGEHERHCDPLHQHLNPLPRNKYIELMEKHGLKQNEQLTNTFLKETRRKRNFYDWWRESFIIWEI
jgi:SAM-dependent methyltransferase